MNSGPSTDLPCLALLSNFRFQLRGFLAFSEAEAERRGITSQQYQLLQVVGEASPTSIGRIAERLMLRHNSAVELVDRAERALLLTRTTDPSDQRRMRIALTAKGSGLLAELIQSHMRFLQHTGSSIVGALEQVLAAAEVTR